MAYVQINRKQGPGGTEGQGRGGGRKWRRLVADGGPAKDAQVVR